MRPEDMRVYQVTRELGRNVDQILAMLPPNLSKLANHLERSSESVGLNLSEGLVAYKPRVKANAFDIARREAGEVRKALQRAVDKKAIHAAAIEKTDQLANLIIGMLTVMIKQQEKRDQDE